MDHKKFLFPQGHALGINIRVTWLTPTSPTDQTPNNNPEFNDFKMFMNLHSCDPSKPDKSIKRTAEMLVDFIHGQMKLEDNYRTTFTSDCAIYKGIIPEMENLGKDMIKFLNNVSILI